MELAEANAVVHNVEDQWHHKFLIAAGFEAITKIQIGFVRRYVYGKNGLEVICSTGVSCDHWSCPAHNAGGYWADLEPFLKGL